jgi:hypothetical protein
LLTKRKLNKIAPHPPLEANPTFSSSWAASLASAYSFGVMGYRTPVGLPGADLGQVCGNDRERGLAELAGSER